jgi:hypothetical protein
MIKKRKLIAFIALIFLISCKPECLPPSSEELWIVIEDSLGNNIIEQEYPDLTLELADNEGSHNVNSEIVSNGSENQRAWYFNIDKMISGYPYLLVYDNVRTDTIAVNWVMQDSDCGGETFYYRSILDIRYNDSHFLSEGKHVIIE